MEHHILVKWNELVTDRERTAREVAELFASEGVEAEVYEDLSQGIERAREKAGEDGVVCCVGSLYLAGDVLRYFTEKTE